ncbi:MAG: M1 family peptidase [Planctomycetes bacterium]|nr:M1 family peptidase [Planctomycetota bacterium]
MHRSTGRTWLLASGAIVIAQAGKLPAPLAPPPAALEHDLRTDYDVRDYRLELFVDPLSQTVRGCGVTAGVVTAPTLEVIELDLAQPLVLQGAVEVHGDLFQKEFVPGAALVAERIDDRVRIQLPEALPRGARFQVGVWYSGRPQRQDDFNGFQWAVTPRDKLPWIASSCQTIGDHTWWPCKASYFHPEDKPDRVAVHVTAPSTLTAVSNGRLVDVERGAGVTTWRWRIDESIPTYAVAIAIGPYVEIKDEVELPGLKRPLPLRYWVLPESEEKARKQFAQVPELLTFFSEKFGPFPFPDAKFGLVETPIWGMEHATVIAYGNSFPDAIRGTGEVDPYELRNTHFDYVLVHEAAHEWWGNAVTAGSWGDFWLHEGFATYAEVLWVEHVHGLESAQEFMAAKKAGISDLATVFRPRRATAAAAYDTQMYDKGAWLLHMLRYVMGEAKFFAAFKDFGSDPRWRRQTCSSADFQATCERHHGASLRAFFQPWLYGTRWPTYTVHQPKLEGTKATISIECKSNSLFKYEMPLDVEATCADGKVVKKRIIVATGANSVELTGDAPIQTIRWPGFRWILCDVKHVP